MGISQVLSDMVHWVIDRALGRSDPLMRGDEAAYEELIEALERSETPYTLIRKIPFTDMLIDPDDTFKTPAEVRLEIEVPVFVTGTTSMGGVSIMLAPLKKIYAEYRLYVIDGKIVTGSRYKLGSRVFYTRDLDPAMLDYARARIAEYCPRQALCLDIAHMGESGDEPYRVIETNSISSAGFYACDMNVFVNDQRSFR